MLTKSEREWLENRAVIHQCEGDYIWAGYWEEGVELEVMQEAAEFEARVAAKLADPFFPPMDKNSTLEFGHFVMPPMDRLRCARIAVEEEFDAEGKRCGVA